MKNSTVKKMKKRMLALLLCIVMMMNGSVSVLASETTSEENEVVEMLLDSLETAHQHTDECYRRNKVSEEPICGKEVAEGHSHGDTCYEVATTQEFTCTLEETAGHSHGDGCFTTVENNVCGQSEHVHGSGCYETEESTEAVCGESEHSHNGDCFTSETVNVCGQEEKEAHAHGDGCYTTTETKTQICTLEETAAHTHGDECYEWSEELICTIPVETADVEPNVQICETCQKETCECEVEETVEICEVCEKETCECETEEAEPIALTTEVDGTTITLSGPAEAFTEGMVYSIEAAIVEAEQEVEVIEEVLEEVAVEQEKVVKNYQAFDIKIIEKDEEGNVTNDNFQPLNETPVMVTFSSKEVAESVENEETETSVLHVDTETKEIEDMAAEVTEEKDVAIETTHFSIYVYVELEEIGEIRVFVEHWIENSEDKLYEDTSFIMEHGFQGTVEQLAEVCYEEQPEVGYKVSKVYSNVSTETNKKEWEEVEGNVVLTKDTELKLEYSPTSEQVEIGDHWKKLPAIDDKITKDKTATPLDENDVSEVTLTVGGTEEDLSSDIVLIMGMGPSSNLEYVTDTIRKMAIATDGTPTKIKLGLVTFGDSIDREVVLPLTEMKPDTMDGIIADALQQIKFNYGGINMESALITARDMLKADTSVPAHRKHLIMVSTGLTYWFDNAEGEEVTVIGKNNYGNYMHGNKYWLMARNGATGTGSGYKIPNWSQVYTNGSSDHKTAWKNYWNMIVSWVEADQEAYVYNPGVTYKTFEKEGNGGEIRPNGHRYGYSIAGEEYLAKVTGAVPYFPGAANPAKNTNAAHALNYEKAQYESWVVFNEMQTPIGMKFETVLNSRPIVEGLGYNCYAIANGVSSQPGEEDRWLSSNQIGYNFMWSLTGGDGKRTVNWRDHKDFFEPIAQEILNTVSTGTTVDDYIGYDPGEFEEEVFISPDDSKINNDDPNEFYNFDFVDDVTTLVLTRDGVKYTVAKVDNDPSKAGVTSTYEFTAPKQEGTESNPEPTFKLEYYKGNGKETEHFVWTFGEDVTDFEPASLKYEVKLVEKNPSIGEHVANTNQYATLNPINSLGKVGDSEHFRIPKVDYEILPPNKWVRIIKENATDDRLKGAEFALYKYDEEDGTYIQVDLNPETAKVDGVITNDNGVAEFEFGYGIYKFKETLAPEGYMLTGTEHTIVYNKNEFEIDGVSVPEEKILQEDGKGSGIVEITIENLPLYELPSTGGYGSLLYTLSGAALVLSSSLIAYKKKREEDLESEK